MEKKFYNRIELMKATPNRITLSYYLLESNINEGFCDLKIYGVLIEKESITKNGAIIKETKSIPDLFFTKSEAEEFLEKIYREKVMPIDLKYAIRPFVKERVGLNAVESV